jgi:uncharacterized membrane protein (UPF0127 family)
LFLHALFLGAILTPSLVFAACVEDRVTLRGEWGHAGFSVDVADDANERGIGLMHRSEMSLSAGMLFVYDHPQSVSFWMKNTLIPLDMLFFDERGVLMRVHENAQPGDLTPIPGGGDVQYVLEINGGLARRLGIKPGSELQHPSVSKEFAAWACS